MNFEENCIIKDARVLTEQFIPSLIVHRDGQMKALRDSLQPILKEQSPGNVILYGESGTGKTSLSRFVLEELSRHSTSLLHSYVNCWLYQSRYTILYNILQDFGKSVIIHRKGTPTDELMDVLRGCLKERKAIIVLDEADQIEGEKIFYDLMGFEGIGLVLISNTENLLFDKDARIRSRFASAPVIEFPKYRTSEIIDILKSRVDWGLVPGTIKETQINTIADIAGGDARVALNTLRAAAEAAENEGRGKILHHHIIRSEDAAKRYIINQKVGGLNPHQRILFEIINEKNHVKPKDLLAEYKISCRDNNLDPVGERMIRKYLSKMIRYGLITMMNEGRWRVYKKQQTHSNLI